MKISLCAIVCDEEQALPVMLDSARLFVDEIVIVDTGSTDKTVEVAKRYTDKVLFRKWDNSFAKARNYGLEQCSGDWILILDADERLVGDNWHRLRSYLADQSPETLVVMPTMAMCRDDDAPYQEFLAERILRNDKRIRFDGDMHNWVTVAGDVRVGVPELRINHNRGVKPNEQRGKRAKQRIEMAESIFLPRIAKDPNDRRALFYLAGTYFDNERIQEAIKYFTQYLGVSGWAGERYQAAILLADALRRVGQDDQARKVLSAHIIDNHKRAEAFVQLGEIALGYSNYEEAETWFTLAKTKDKPADPMFVDVAAHTWMPDAGLWTVHKETGKVDLAGKAALAARQNGAPLGSGILRWLKNHTKYRSERIAVLADRGQINFVQPLMDYWTANGKQVRATDKPDEDIYQWADIIWCEWAGPLAEWVTNSGKRCRVIVRVHGYELYNGMLDKVNWENVDDAVFVSVPLLQDATRQTAGLSAACNLYVVPGGVITQGFGISEGKTGKKIAMAGFVNARKNLPMALQILAKLPDHELHVAGQWQDAELQKYCENTARELGVADRFKTYGFVEDLNAWFADKDFILSTSVRETFHYTLAEGMAAGLKPVVHCWESARDFYPSEYIFSTVDEAVDMLSDAGEPSDYRQYAVGHLDVGRNIDRVRRIIERPSVAVCGEPKYPHALERKLLLALDSVGCRTDAPKPDLVILMGHTPRVEPYMADSVKVLWHLEQVVGDDPHAQDRRKKVLPVIKDVDVVATLNPNAVEWFKEQGAKRVVHVPCVFAAPPFRKLDGVAKEFDVGFCGFLNDRRNKILEELGKRFDIKTFENHDHDQVNLFYNKCKVVLNLHCTDEPDLEMRIGEALAAGAFVLSEPLPYKIPGVHEHPNGLASGVGAALKYYDEPCSHYEHGWNMRAHDWIWREATLAHRAEQILSLVGF